MSIQFQCSNGHKINAPDQYAGKKVKCPKCGTPTLVAPPPAKKDDYVKADLVESVMETDPFGGMLPAVTENREAFDSYIPVPVRPASKPVAIATPPKISPRVIASFAGLGSGVLTATVLLFAFWFFLFAKPASTSQMVADNPAQQEGVKGMDSESVETSAETESPQDDDSTESTANSKVYFGFDVQMRTLLAGYMAEMGSSKINANLFAMRVRARLKKIAQEFDLRADENGLVALPEAFKPLRENFNKGTYLSDGIGLYSPDKIELPAEMSELKKAYLADAYVGKLKDLTFLVFLAYTFNP
jgi:hypothetical protein